MIKSKGAALSSSCSYFYGVNFARLLFTSNEYHPWLVIRLNFLVQDLAGFSLGEWRVLRVKRNLFGEFDEAGKSKNLTRQKFVKFIDFAEPQRRHTEDRYRGC